MRAKRRAIPTEGLEEAEFLGSRLTRPKVRRQTLAIADAVARLTGETRALLPEIDTGTAGPPRRTASARTRPQRVWLRVYRENQPDLFR